MWLPSSCKVFESWKMSNVISEARISSVFDQNRSHHLLNFFPAFPSCPVIPVMRSEVDGMFLLVETAFHSRSVVEVGKVGIRKCMAAFLVQGFQNPEYHMLEIVLQDANYQSHCRPSLVFSNYPSLVKHLDAQFLLLTSGFGRSSQLSAASVFIFLMLLPARFQYHCVPSAS